MAQHQDSRMYEAKYPEVDDVVMVQVRTAKRARISADSALVGLLGLTARIYGPTGQVDSGNGRLRLAAGV